MFGYLYCVSRNGFQKLEKIKDSNRQSRQLEELTGKMRECKRYSWQIPFGDLSMGLILQSAFAFSARIENGELCLDVEEKFDLFAFMNRNLEKEIVNKGAYLLGLAV